MNDQSTNMMNQHQQQHMMSMNPNPQMMSMNQHQQQQQMVNRGYGLWGPPLVPPMDQLKFQNPNPNMNAPLGGGGGFVSGKQHLQGSKVLGPRINWKGKKVNDKRKDGRRNENFNIPLMTGTSSGPGGISGGGGGGYKPPMLKELQHQNRVKAQRFFTKKKFNHNNNNNNNFNSRNNNMGKFAPRNTSSFLIRAKKSGGIAELVSPCPVTPAVLPTPMFSPSREDLVDMAKEEWGVDGYGSMKGLIRLRTPGSDDEDEDEDGGSSESDVEEHAEMEKRLDHDLSRFEMIYPNCNGGIEYNNNTNNNNVLENRVDDQDTHIAQLEEENMILKERLFLMEREFDDLRRRLQFLESQGGQGGGEEVVENESENDSGDVHSMEFNNEGSTEVNEDVKSKDEINDIQSANEDDDNDQNVTDAGVKEVMEQNNDVSDVHKDKLTQTRKQEE